MFTSAKFSKLDWEFIEQNNKPISASEQGSYTRRVKIPGGWLVESVIRGMVSDGIGYGLGLTFVPDPEHKWKIE